MQQRTTESPAVGTRPAEPPRDFDGLTRRLVAERERLPGRLAQVGEYALTHPDEVAFSTVAALAEAAGVQPSAFVRFAQALGYAGFSELQQVFRDRLRARAGVHQERLSQLRATEGEHGAGLLLTRFTEAAGSSLARLGRTVRPEAIEAAAAILAEADTVHLVGLRRAFPVASYLAYALAQLDLRCRLVDHVGGLGAEQVAGARAGDALVAISFTPYTPTTVDLANACARRGVRVVAITDSPFSPLAAAAEVRLEVVEADVSGFRSVAATFCLAATLAVATGERRATA